MVDGGTDKADSLIDLVSVGLGDKFTVIEFRPRHVTFYQVEDKAAASPNIQDFGLGRAVSGDKVY